jgi:hypothetical protein
MDDSEPLRSMVAGALAGAVEATATCPLDTIKVALQHPSFDPRDSRVHNTVETLLLSSLLQVRLQTRVTAAGGTHILGIGRGIVAKEGILGLWTGWTPLMLGVMVKKAIRFWSFAAFTNALQHRHYKLSPGSKIRRGVVQNSPQGCLSKIFARSLDVPLPLDIYLRFLQG